MSLATPADWALYKGLAETPEEAATYYDDRPDERLAVAAKLAIASDDVAGYLRLSVYAVDTDGNATNPGVIRAISRATCAQADYFDETGDTTGAQAQYDSVKIGSVSLSRNSGRLTGATTAEQTLVSPRALTILANAGLRNSIVGYY